jgi:transcription-repair coupling factor (superfamily II helicase)
MVAATNGAVVRRRDYAGLADLHAMQGLVGRT